MKRLLQSGVLCLGLCILIYSESISATKYTVAPGDSLMTISYKYYGTHQCWEIILDANDFLKFPSALSVGDVLQIPEKSNCKKKPRVRKKKKKKVKAKAVVKKVAPKLAPKPPMAQPEQIAPVKRELKFPLLPATDEPI